MHTILQALCLAHQLLEVLHLVPASAHRRSRRSSTFPAAAPPRWLAAALSVRVPRRQRAWPVLSSAPGAARLRPAAPLRQLRRFAGRQAGAGAGASQEGEVEGAHVSRGAA